jgi:CheY-like chemotaxis protein
MTERETFLSGKDLEVAPLVLLVIDDSPAFRESIEFECEYRGWTVMASEKMQTVLDWLPQHSPDVVLLDWQLPGQQRRNFAQMLRDQDLTKRTLLLTSGEMDDRRQQLISEFGLVGFKLKPLDLDRLDEEIRIPEPLQEWPGLEVMADQLDVCIDILGHTLNWRWGNADARQEPLTIEQRLIVQWLRASITDRGHKAARRLD